MNNLNRTDFSERLALIDREKIKAYLCSMTEPCYESTLLKIAFPDLSIFRASALVLYQAHFLLFHILYQLQDEFYQQNQYLFVHFMRTALTPYPALGLCRFYDEYSGRFCSVPCKSSQNYCDFHHKRLGDSSVEELSLKYFYLDMNNFYCLDEKQAESFINGTWEILQSYDKYKNSFKILGISETSDIDLIRRRFRALAQIHHPDKGAESCEKFNEINGAYRLLMRLLPCFTHLKNAD